jgi:hypothetical protein
MLMLSGISVEKCCRAAGQAKARLRRTEGDRGTKGLRAWHHVLTAAANPTELTLSGISVEKCCRAAGQAKGRGAGSESGRRGTKRTNQRTNSHHVDGITMAVQECDGNGCDGGGRHQKGGGGDGDTQAGIEKRGSREAELEVQGNLETQEAGRAPRRVVRGG